MFIALDLFAALGDPVGRVVKSSLVTLHVPNRVEGPADCAGPEATVL
jgi:hypothetical protein